MTDLIRPALVRVVEALEAEEILSPKLHQALTFARNRLRQTTPVECPHCAGGIVRVKFNNRYFHELGDDVFVCAVQGET